MPSGAVFRARVIALSFQVSGPALAIVLAGLTSLLDLTSEQWSWLVVATVVYALIETPLLFAHQWGMVAPVVEWLDGAPSHEAAAAAFARVVDLPRRAGLVGAVGWLAPVAVLAAVMKLRFPEWGAFESCVLLGSGVAAAFVSGIFVFLCMKRRTQAVCQALAEALPDPAERGALVRPIALRTKLLVSLVGVTAVSALFSVLLAHGVALRAIDRVAMQWESELLEAGLAEAPLAQPAFAGALRLLEVDLAVPRALESAVQESAPQLRAEIAAGAARGDSRGLPTDEVFAWRRAPGAPNRIEIAILPRAALAVDVSRTGALFGLLLLVSTGVAVGLSWLLAGDVSRATEGLRGEALRWSQGDLRRGRVWESEDELGDLWRSFEGMVGSLRETVGRVAEAADRVEATSGEMVEVAASVAGVTADQVRGIEQATGSMEAIGVQVRGIAESSAALNVSVEESSSSVLELGAAGEELLGTAGALSEQVNEVGASIDQMVRSVREVLGSTESLSAAAEETSASMGEMAQSLREVDASAEQTARLSGEVVESAERGRGKLREAWTGMDAIRAATEAAEGVVRTLGSRTREIGAVVDVIDEVADETSLLALNAAIIAAQAGEHGRAFSVVAEEIKDLAERVLASTKEIGGLIRSVQEEGTAAIGAIERGTRSVAVGSDLWSAAGSSWEAITKASRETGERMAGIVGAVREQSRASGHVMELMERVREGVESIRRAAAEQDRGNGSISRSAGSMREVALQVRGTTEEQARGSARIRESVDGVREAVEQINGALQEQSAACRSASALLEALWRRTQHNEDSAGRLGRVARDLAAQAQGLRQHVEKFQVG